MTINRKINPARADTNGMTQPLVDELSDSRTSISADVSDSWSSIFVDKSSLVCEEDVDNNEADVVDEADDGKVSDSADDSGEERLLVLDVLDVLDADGNEVVGLTVASVATGTGVVDVFVVGLVVDDAM